MVVCAVRTVWAVSVGCMECECCVLGELSSDWNADEVVEDRALVVVLLGYPRRAGLRCGGGTGGALKLLMSVGSSVRPVASVVDWSLCSK